MLTEEQKYDLINEIKKMLEKSGINPKAVNLPEIQVNKIDCPNCIACTCMISVR